MHCTLLLPFLYKHRWGENNTQTPIDNAVMSPASVRGSFRPFLARKTLPSLWASCLRDPPWEEIWIKTFASGKSNEVSPTCLVKRSLVHRCEMCHRSSMPYRHTDWLLKKISQALPLSVMGGSAPWMNECSDCFTLEIKIVFIFGLCLKFCRICIRSPWDVGP